MKKQVNPKNVTANCNGETVKRYHVLKQKYNVNVSQLISNFIDSVYEHLEKEEGKEMKIKIVTFKTDLK